MTATFEANTPIERRILARSLETLRKHAGMDMVFGGPVRHGAVSMEITDLTGVRTRSAVNLVVRNGEGLGGKALMLGTSCIGRRLFRGGGDHTCVRPRCAPGGDPDSRRVATHRRPHTSGPHLSGGAHPRSSRRSLVRQFHPVGEATRT